MSRTTFIATATTLSALSIAPQTSAATPQRTSGLYVTAADYREGRLASEGDCKSAEHKLELHDMLNKPYIDVTHGAGHRRYMKSAIFGFRSCEGIDYRFAGSREYQILEARELYIYVIQAPARLGKDTARGLSKVSTYFFSVGAEGNVLPLSLINLRQAFPANHRFHDSLDAAFQLGGLEQYDDFHKMFKVNHVLEASEDR
jgi:hypothetical protein